VLFFVGAGVFEEQDGDAAGALAVGGEVDEEDAPAALLEAAVEDFVEGVEVGGGEDVLGFVDDEGVEAVE
jgi:hypothetical protein